MAKATKQATATAPAIELGEPGRPSLARALTPRILLDSTPAEWLFKLDVERRHLILLAVLAASVFFPYLGAVGFWDPWEPHYGEVARSMIVRQDFIHPYWESAYFFSKPVLPMWLMSLGMLIAGADDPARGISVSTEWWVRSIYALVAISGVLFAYLGVARTLSRRAGIWTAVVLITSPLYFLLARQAMVDMPFEVLNVMAIACLMIAVYEKERVQDGWLYAFYALAGVATLAKGLLGIALPGAAMLGYLVLSGDWRLLARLRLITGPLVTLVIMAPWYGTMIAFDGKDDESKTFFERFIIHDHFKRFGIDPQRGEFIGGVHTTTPNTTWTYYFEQLGFGMFPWVALLPGALANVLGPRKPDDAATRRRKARLFVVAWGVTSFAFFAFAATKFHHYAFSILPPLAILVGLYVDQLLEEGVRPHALALLAGGIIFAGVGQNLTMEPSHLINLYVYNYDRPYPLAEVTPNLPALPWRAGLPAIVDWVRDLLFANVRRTFSFLMVLAPLFVVVGGFIPKGRGRTKEEPSDRLWALGTVAVFAVLFAVYVSAWHWRKVTPHWSQRDLFWTYHQESAASEPIGAYQMNWRGETFYSRNTVRQLKEAQDLRDFVAHPGREWVLVEHSRLAGMKTTLGSQYKVREVDRTNNKFMLVVVE